MSQRPTLGARVCILFSLCLEDGTDVDGTDDGTPWCFTVGDGSLIPPLEDAICTLAVGESQRFLIGAADAYGHRDDSLVCPLPRADFPPHISPEPGVAVSFGLPSGEEIAGLIVGTDDEQVFVDLNHPLAGHAVRFDVQLVSCESGGNS